jgi:hypothetical protein
MKTKLIIALALFALTLSANAQNPSPQDAECLAAQKTFDDETTSDMLALASQMGPANPKNTREYTIALERLAAKRLSLQDLETRTTTMVLCYFNLYENPKQATKYLYTAHMYERIEIRKLRESK